LVTDQEIGEARVMLAKYAGDMKSKKQAIEVATRELSQAKLVLSQHFLKSQLPGHSTVKKIYKSNGEGIKALEPVLHLQKAGELRIEGSVDSQYFSTLRANKNARCYVVPSEEMGPAFELMKAHRHEVTCVAACADGEHFVSG